MGYYNGVSQTLGNLSSLLSTLHKQYNGFNKRVSFGKNTNIAELTLQTSSLFKSLQKASRQQSKLLKKTIFRNLEYSIEEFTSISEVR